MNVNYPDPDAIGGGAACSFTDGEPCPPDEHRWVTKRQGGSPDVAESYERVTFCEVCGMEKPAMTTATTKHTADQLEVRPKGVREAGADHDTFIGVPGGGLVAYVVTANGSGTSQELWGRARANAARLVHCWNSHKGLFHCLQLALHHLDNPGIPITPASLENIRTVLERTAP